VAACFGVIEAVTAVATVVGVGDLLVEECVAEHPAPSTTATATIPDAIPRLRMLL
jgi:hypothetical protein